MKEKVLKMHPKFHEDILGGEKTITLRKGKREFENKVKIEFAGDVEFEGQTLKSPSYDANIHSVTHQKLNEVDFSDLKSDGFKSFAHVMEVMKQFYPDITPESDITIVRFWLEGGEELRI